MTKPTALIAGATGLVGTHLLKQLLSEDYYHQITVLTRKELDLSDERLQIVILPDFDQLAEYEHLFDVNHVYCCLGTTRKEAGSKLAFRKAELDYPLQIAKLAKDKPSFQSFHVVTSIASSKFAAIYYNTLKGHLELALKGMKLRALKIYQPSLLLGRRKKQRIQEELAKVVCFLLSFFIIGSGKSPWAIHSQNLARSMFGVAKLGEAGTETFTPRDMLILNHKL
ncbi:MAG: NAD-dependent epimerase/dehydratase family protein [Cyclobacteriaceae bacterium]|nr:NAD-dependent epimerase/dehydratase family protein [Cyclobacteriaceae bacterium]